MARSSRALSPLVMVSSPAAVSETRLVPVGRSGPPQRAARRRARDRLLAREGTRNRALLGRHELQNLLLFVDDDLRETARAMEQIEGFLVSALHLLEREDVSRDDLAALAEDEQVLLELDQLGDTLESLRARMGKIAGVLD